MSGQVDSVDECTMSSEGIKQFWLFWADHRDEIEKSIHDGTLHRWIEPIEKQVKQVGEGLDWELGKGIRAEHYLCVTANGNQTLRVLTERWRAAGPGDDAVFEYYASRPGGGFSDDASTNEMVFNGVTFNSVGFRFALDIDDIRRHVHVDVWHPRFEGTSEKVCTSASFIWLDSVFGEDDVERWIGEMRLLDSEPKDSVGWSELVAVVDDFRANAGDERFTVLRAELPTGEPVFVTANLGIKRVDHLLMDLHIEISLTLVAPTEQGLTTQGEADDLNDAEDLLLESLGRDAINIGRETRQGLRILHFHAANGGPAVRRIEEWTSALKWDVEIVSSLDPMWSILRRW